MHKDTIFYAIYNGKQYGEIKEYSTFAGEIRIIGMHLWEEDVTSVTIESTGKGLISAGFMKKVSKKNNNIFEKSRFWECP